MAEPSLGANHGWLAMGKAAAMHDDEKKMKVMNELMRMNDKVQWRVEDDVNIVY